MAKFHLTPEGPRECRAVVRPCPYGGESGEENHYESMGAAEVAFALSMGGSFAPTPKRNTLLRSAEVVRRGLGNDPQESQALARLDEEARELRGSLSQEDTYLLDYYKENGYVGMKALQLGGFYMEGFKKRTLDRYPDQEQRDEVLEGLAKANERLARIYREHEGIGEPRTLYRLQNLTEFTKGGRVNQEEFLQSLQPGQEFSFPSWASTSADSDFALSSGEKTREFHPERPIVIFEVATKRGLSLHNTEDHYESVQSREREVLLAPGEKYRVVGVQREVRFQEAGELSVAEQLAGESKKQGRYTVVQLEEM